MDSQVHGALVDVLGVGVLILGPSGIGKSETALELVRRGNRLVADDVVRVRVEKAGLVASAPPLIRHHIEIRGLGILYLPDLFGPEAVVDEFSVDLACHLEHWREGSPYERTGLDRPSEEILGVSLPALLLPMRPGGNMATLIEVAVRDYKVRKAGIVAPQRLDARLREEVEGR